MNKILVPVDFSDNSRNALSYAAQLFKGSEFEITVLHTYLLNNNAFHLKSMDYILEEDAHRDMDALVNEIKEEVPDIKLKTIITKGDAISTIIVLGNKGSYDFIVMGTKGASGLKEVFIGSVTGGVICKTKAPVLVVPDHSRYRALDEIIFAISGLPFSDISVIEPLRQIKEIVRSKIRLLHIGQEEEPSLEEALGTFEDLSPTVTYSFSTGNINDRLHHYLTNEDVDLLCLVRTNKGFFTRLFEGSITLKQTFNSPVPLLILHDY